MFTAEEKVVFLSKKINKISSHYDHDYLSLVAEGVSEELAGELIESAAVREIEKIVTVFETLNPNIFIYNIERIAGENGHPVVNLEWTEVEEEE